jgi:hypothetical protein
MDLSIITLLGYLAAGVVFITRAADQAVEEAAHAQSSVKHPFLRMTAGLAMLLLWPAFLLAELIESGPAPMAVRVDHSSE